MEKYLERINADKEHKGRKTYTGHPSKEDDLIILDNINLIKGNSCEYDAYDEYGIIHK